MQPPKTKGFIILIWVARLAAAILLVQTLFFKFTGAEESISIFTRLGIEPWGRIGSGVVELIASVLILIPATTGIGALLGLGTMAGAIFSHLAVLGIAVKNSDGSSDGGLLFMYAVIVFIACLFLVWVYRKQIPVLGKLF
jgi:uncharacterized membrane protein YphA (DoxX/SURF4 family)